MNQERAGVDQDRQRAFLALLEPCLAPLNRFAMAICRGGGRDARPTRDNIERAKDIVQETILRAFESFERVREQRAFQSYLFTIAVRIHRTDAKRAHRTEPIASEHFALASNGLAPDANADISQLYAALAELPEEQREAIVMSEIVGLSLAEVAEAQNATLTAVKTRVSRGRKRLAELLGVTDEAPRALPRPLPQAGGEIILNARFAFQAKDRL